MIRHKAFTLIEVMLSVSLVVILLAIMVARLSLLSEYWLYREQDQLAAVITYVRHKAIAANTQQKILLYPEQKSYSYGYPGVRHKTITLGCGVSFGWLPGTSGPPAQPERPIVKPITFPMVNNHYEIICHPDGTVTAGTLYLLDSKKKTMVALTINIGTFAMVRKYKHYNYRWVVV